MPWITPLSGGGNRWPSWRPGRRRPRTLAIAAEGRLGNLGNAGERAQHAGCLDWHDQNLLVRRLRKPRERLHVFVGNEIVERGDVTGSDRLADHAGCLGLGL